MVKRATQSLDWLRKNAPRRPLPRGKVAPVEPIYQRLWCFGTNDDGSPKHPLYLPSATRLERYRGAA